MNNSLFSDGGISEDPYNGMHDLLAHYDDDIEGLSEVLTEFFVECPECWKQFCHFWHDWSDTTGDSSDI